MSYDEYMALAQVAGQETDPAPDPAADFDIVALPPTRREDRLIAPGQMPDTSQRWLIACVVLTLFVHGFIAAVLLRRDRTAALQPKPEATPVEVIVEPPKPQPKPKPPEVAKKEAPPPPPPQQSLEKPANSAPRAPNEEKVETKEAQKETHAPKAPEPPKAGQPKLEAETDPAEEMKADQDKADEAAAQEDVLKDDAEALDRAAPKPSPQPKPKKAAKATPQRKPRKVPDALEQLAGASDLPDYSFARPAKRAPVSGGTEDNRYLAVVYGMIMQNRSLIGIPTNVGGTVTITFNVDDDGNVTSMAVARTSGYPQIDAAAGAAIRRASPFPPPPAGAPHSLVATIDFGPAALVPGARR